MSWFSALFAKRKNQGSRSGLGKVSLKTHAPRRCHFEAMEPRRLLSANPLWIGAVYIEEDLGSDIHGDTFELTFVGGAPGTELTRVVIDSEREPTGLSAGDAIFDTTGSGLGADQPFPLTILSLQTADPQAAVQAHVVDGSSLLVLDFSRFRGGDKLVFSIDVDEVEIFDANVTDPVQINEGLDPVTSGIEFQGSILRADFSAPRYHDIEGTGEFRNRYDDALSGTGLNLPADDFEGKRDRTAGVVVGLQQQPKPVSLAGTVFLDSNLNLVQDGPETGLAGVTLELWRKEQSGYVYTGHSATTDAGGDYRFGTDLNLQPGTYQIREHQPASLFSVGAIPGQVEGGGAGSVLVESGDILTSIELPLGDQHAVNFNFAEAQPAVIRGFVYHDRNNNGERNPGEEGLPDVPIQVIAVNTIQPQSIVSVTTDSQGAYLAGGLAPGTYRIVEPSQPAGYFDGIDTAGTVDGLPTGNAVNPGDNIEQIRLLGGARGEEYNFGEIRPSSIHGNVRLSDSGGDCDGPGSAPITGVTIRLFDGHGQLVAETVTGSDGQYHFDGLPPGSYSVVELTPEGLIDGDEHPGNIDGTSAGRVTADDTIGQIVLVSGQVAGEFNFCEHVPASLSGHVYHDENNNGTFDAGETAIPDVQIVLRTENGDEIQQLATDADGFYEFANIPTGVYSVTETQPTGWLDGLDAAGRVGTTVRGVPANPGDRIEQIALGWGEAGRDYDFGELLAASISGFVYEDVDQDCVFDAHEAAIADVTVELYGVEGRLVAVTETNELGRYHFDQLSPGAYSVRELQPAGYFQGGQQAGSHGGDDSQLDVIRSILVGSGQHLTDYNFCELPPASLAGVVHTDVDRDQQLGPHETPLPGVVIRLVDSGGQLIATERTNAAGQYRFDNLAPGRYAVEEVQPAEYFDAGQRAGSHGGDDGGVNAISRIGIEPGQDLTEYNFFELPAATLSGFVFQDGPAISTFDAENMENIGTLRDGEFTSDDTPLAGVALTLRDGVTGEPIDASQALPGLYPAGPIRTVTGTNGHYMFRGLPAGVYAVYEVQPAGYVDGIDTPGTTSGIAINPAQEIDPEILESLSADPGYDAIVRIPLEAGMHSEDNNFSEIRISPLVLAPPPVLPAPRPVAEPIAISRVVYEQPLILAPPPPPTRIFVGDVGGSVGFTWHLSVVNGGMPRGIEASIDPNNMTWMTAAYLDSYNWSGDQLSEGVWTILINKRELPQDQEDDLREFIFGIHEGIPVSGDFDGDGVTDLGLYYKGEWFLDLNGNGRWDEEDLWAQLGSEADLPVVGDWDGDGKDDIGIFGPQWRDDVPAINAEPGLPDHSNVTQARPKNLPPDPGEATSGLRVLQLTTQGKHRADVIDHVFRFGVTGDLPVAGDWNGDGIDSIGVFRGGVWVVDSDGDGRLSDSDPECHFGQLGDIPVVGDFNADGVDEIGVFRGGRLYVDTNGNRELDAHDKVFELGVAADTPVVGDWNGDGADEAGVYHEVVPGVPVQARK